MFFYFFHISNLHDLKTSNHGTEVFEGSFDLSSKVGKLLFTPIFDVLGDMTGLFLMLFDVMFHVL